jgi:hypothetical protein
MSSLTPPPNKPQRGVRATFANQLDAFIAWLINFVVEMAALVAGLNTLAAGSAYAIPYTVDLSSTADADPTAGKLRFNAATQNATTTIYLDLTGSDGADYTSIIDQFDASTSAVKGQIRIVKQGDPTKFLTFDVTARTTATGYRKLSLTNTGGSSASPFLAGDGVLIKFTRTGDKGVQGVSGFSNKDVITATQTWVCPAGVTKAEVTVVNGGAGGAYSTGGSGNNIFPGGGGGAAGVSVLTLTPNGSYTATVGAGGTTGATPGAGGASSFAGPGITTLTSGNATLKVPGGAGLAIPGSIRGGSLLSPPGASGYGAGGLGGNDAGSTGTAGSAGIIIIRY